MLKIMKSGLRRKINLSAWRENKDLKGVSVANMDTKGWYLRSKSLAGMILSQMQVSEGPSDCWTH